MKALELEFPVSNIRTAVQVSLGALRSTEYARPIGSVQFSVRWDAIQLKLKIHAFYGTCVHPSSFRLHVQRFGTH